MRPATAPKTAQFTGQVTVSQALLWTVFCVLVCLSAYGLYSGHLFSQDIWSARGLDRLVLFTAGYGAAAGGLILWRPRWLPAAAVVLAFAYTVAAVGARSPATVGYVLFSALMLGKWVRRQGEEEDQGLAVVLGLAIWTGAVSLAVHFPINYPAGYVAALAIPIIWNWRDSLRILRGLLTSLERSAPTTRMEAAALAALLFALAAQLLAVLAPEVSSDGLAMHLVIPAQVAARHRWSFDFQEFTWALMPMGGDWSFTLAYLLGGEYAARLLNFSFLPAICALLWGAMRGLISRPSAFLLVALFAATPLVHLETGSLFVENFWVLLLLGALLALARFHEHGREADVYTSAALVGSTLAVKFGALAFAVPALAFVVCEIFRRRENRLKKSLVAALCFVVLAVPAYANAFRLTGNPVYPFLNRVFHSPYFDVTTSLRNERYTSPLSWHTPWDVTFHSSRFLESQDGSFGFQYLLLVPLALLVVRRNSPYQVRLALAVALTGFVVTFLGNPTCVTFTRHCRCSRSEWLSPSVLLWAAGFAVRFRHPWLPCSP